MNYRIILLSAILCVGSIVNAQERNTDLSVSSNYNSKSVVCSLIRNT
ncbi:MAG TPA: hypothetical protein VK166_03190 [Chitinophagaceae bacterium]|nr:hypothetical protein [Chitinophagaceae bacterium]